MNQSDIETAILQKLYIAYFRGDGAYNLNTIREELGFDDTALWKAADYMTHRGLINAWTVGGNYRIDALGVIHAEENGIVPKEIRKENQHIRTVALDALAKAYEQSGSLADADIETLSQSAVTEPNAMANNLRVLHDLGYVEPTTLDSVDSNFHSRGIAGATMT